MTLTWPQINDLAAALLAAHGHVDRLSVTSGEMLSYLRDIAPTLPTPTADEMNAIRWQWMKLAEAPPGAKQAGGRA